MDIRKEFNNPENYDFIITDFEHSKEIKVHKKYFKTVFFEDFFRDWQQDELNKEIVTLHVESVEIAEILAKTFYGLPFNPSVDIDKKQIILYPVDKKAINYFFDICRMAQIWEMSDHIKNVLFYYLHQNINKILEDVKDCTFLETIFQIFHDYPTLTMDGSTYLVQGNNPLSLSNHLYKRLLFLARTTVLPLEIFSWQWLVHHWGWELFIITLPHYPDQFPPDLLYKLIDRQTNVFHKNVKLHNITWNQDNYQIVDTLVPYKATTYSYIGNVLRLKPKYFAIYLTPNRNLTLDTDSKLVINGTIITVVDVWDNNCVVKYCMIGRTYCIGIGHEFKANIGDRVYAKI